MKTWLFTSESVAAGHPDKMADQISDAVLDEVIRQSGREKKRLADIRVACETLVKTGMVVLAGEMRSEVWVDIEEIARQVVADIGYDRHEYGFHSRDCAVVSALGKQSPDIAQGVDSARAGKRKKKIGAGDQGLMFGYACRETKTLMPLAIDLAHRLMRRHAKARQKSLPWLGPDAKAQVTLRYEGGKPRGIDAIVLSTQHDETIDNKRVRDSDPRIAKAVRAEIIDPVAGARIDSQTRVLINPTGRFVIGGPKGDCGLTGRKIIVDTYGGSAPHGGGAFSGKDPTKVDRSACYMMRYLAKNIVAAGAADRCLVQAAYAIGVAEPVSLMIDTFGGGKMSAEEIARRARKHFDLTPEGIIETLDLWRPIYRQTAAYGHFGREEPDFAWEKTDRKDCFRA